MRGGGEEARDARGGPDGPDLNWEEALATPPEWAMRNKDGSVQYNTEEPRLFKTCMFSTYMDDYVTAIIREINSLAFSRGCF